MTNFAIPFSLTPTGEVSTVIDPDTVGTDRMESLIGTYPGERVMLPEYGVNIPPQLFSANLEAEQSLLSLQITRAVQNWEPTLILNSVSVQAVSQEPGISRINVNYSLSNNNQLTPPKVAVILTTGTVIG